MKILTALASCMAFFAVSSAHCLDLTLNDGTVYKNVTVFTKTLDGINIENHKDNGVRVLRHVMYSDLSPDSIKLFPEYDKAKAEEYLASLDAKIEAALAKDADKQAEWAKQVQAKKQVVYPTVADSPAVWLVFKATKNLQNGSIGWASAPETEGLGAKGRLGKIYVYGLKITESNQWAGNLYLTDKIMLDDNEGFPCYVTSQDMVDILNKRTSLR